MGCATTAVAVNKKSADHDDAGHRRHDPRFPGAVRHQHEEGDAGAGAEQHGGTDDVQVLEREVERHQRSSRIASATRLRTIIGSTFKSGPSGSAHSPGSNSVATAT